MMFEKVFLPKGLISLSLAIALSIFIGKYPEVAAQSQGLTDNTTETGTVFFNPPTPEDNGAPSGNREGAGSHGLCKMADRAKDTTPLMAIMPEVDVKTSSKNKVYVWGETISAHPTFWFYVAYPVNSQVEFILQDELGNEVYQTSFLLDKTSGLISLTLPQNQVKLEQGQSYHWYLYIMCNPESSPDDFVEGWVKRVDLNSNIHNRLESAQPLERVAIYAQNGLWFDTLSSIESLRQTEPENPALANIWTDLLQQVGLEPISQEPVVKHYNLAN